MSRTLNALRNSAYGIAGKIALLALSLVSRTIFIRHLGNAYVGVNGLYTEILSVLSFTELGIGNALIYAMYEPVAHEKELETVQLLDFYRKAYRLIACAVALLGAAVIPFLPHIVKGADFLTLRELRLYYVIFLFNTVCSYFVTYKYSYVNALQKNYITTTFDTAVSAVTVVIQIAVILLTDDFLAYLLTQSACLALSRIVAVLYLNRRFPILRKKPAEPLPAGKRRRIFTDVKALALGQFASVAVHSTDNIIISSLSGLGVLGVGLVNNYMMLINHVLGFVTILFNSVVAGFGNLAATSGQEEYREAFEEANFINFWIYGFCSIAFFVLTPPFIALWIGEESLIDSVSFLLIIINLYLQGQCTIYMYARSAKGEFRRGIVPVIVQHIVNLVVSIIGAKTLGLVGVYIGTVVSRLVLVMRPSLEYRYFFGRSAWEYYGKLVLHFAATFLAGLAVYAAVQPLLPAASWGRFVMGVCVVAILPNLIFLLLFFRSKEFKAVLVRVKNLLSGALGGNTHE